MSLVGTSRTSIDVRLESANWGKADIDQVAVTNRDFMSESERDDSARDREQSLLGSCQLRTVVAARERMAAEIRRHPHRSVIRLFRVCAERRPDCSYKAVFVTLLGSAGPR
jgi:hypothetical protein